MKPIETKLCSCGVLIRASRERCRACVAFARRERRIVFPSADVVEITVNAEPRYPFPQTRDVELRGLGKLRPGG